MMTITGKKKILSHRFNKGQQKISTNNGGECGLGAHVAIPHEVKGSKPLL